MDRKLVRKFGLFVALLIGAILFEDFGTEIGIPFSEGIANYAMGIALVVFWPGLFGLSRRPQ